MTPTWWDASGPDLDGPQPTAGGRKRIDDEEKKGATVAWPVHCSPGMPHVGRNNDAGSQEGEVLADFPLTSAQRDK